MMKSILYFIVLSLPQLGNAFDDQTGATIDYGTFENPAARIRPRFRYWLPDASVDPDIVQQNIRDAGSIGLGGVEFLPYYNYGETVSGADWSTYGFGTPAFINVFKAALQAHKDSGLVMDFPLGPSQGQGVPASTDDAGLQWDLSAISAQVPKNGSFHGVLPGWGTGDLVAVVSAQVLSTRRNLSNPDSAIPIFGSQPSYTEYTLKNSTLQEWSQNVSPSGELRLTLPPHVNSYRLFAFYQHLTLQNNVPSTTNASKSIFDNGSYTVDHFSARGAQTVTRFWDQHILKGEVKQLLQTVGNYGWEDSMEILSNTSWTPSLPNIFMDKYKYSIKPYLPLIIYGNNNINIQSGAPGIIRCILDTPDQGSGYVNDFRGALLEGYRAYIQHLTKWVNAMGLQYSSQVSYNMPLDALANVPFVDAPECESLQFSDNVDGYRQFSGPAVLTGKRVISNEMGAVTPKAYQHLITDLLWQIGRAVAGGVNQVVLHGQTYTGNYYDTTWPGNTPFWYLFSELYSEKQPSWSHGFSEAIDYIGRLQYTQQKGQPKIDVVIYNKESATNPNFATVYNDNSLINQGFSYVYLSPDNFALPQAYVKNGTLAPTGPEFRAMIIPSSSNLTVQGVRDIRKYALEGLPVILSGGLPHAYLTKGGDTTDLLEEITALKETRNVYSVNAGEAAKKLLDIGIGPRVHIQANGTWYPTWRSGFDGIDYLYILGDVMKSSGQLNVATTKRPYFFDLWTGKKSPVLHYQQARGRITIPLSLAANQTTVIGFTNTHHGNTSLHANELPSSVIGYHYGNETGKIELHVSADTQDIALKLSNGKTMTDLVAQQPTQAYQLSNWNLTVEHWERPSNLSDASMIAEKRNTTHQLPSLVSWQIIPSIANASGVGYYTTTLSWPPTSGSADGAYIFLPQTTNGARLFINGHCVPAFDYQAPKIDITPYLMDGENHLRVDVPSVMWNYLRTMLDELRTGGSAAKFVEFETEAPGPVDNGLIGEVWVVPYVRVQVGH
ncbi:hypothetical protein FE257_003331 [Aspergillus nanangensis]|uniref:Secreted protein n=1 Tax=Aspergillus nanangensis TaxID=2582783 RepID=A0AAD4CSM5_ASPNN|nr:hypothetical protein FE257_003331 [Aspergillus nanangensis]